MKFTHEMQCECGGRFMFSAYGDARFVQAACSNCARPGSLIDPLSVSVTAERLLYRNKAELESGEYSLSIVIAVMAVESFLTRLFLKIKGMDSYMTTFRLPIPHEEAVWEEEYPRSGGFPSPVGFVSKRLLGMSFDDFVAKNAVARAIFSALTNASNFSATEYFQNELFKRRNRIVHWGYVNSSKAGAELCRNMALRWYQFCERWIGQNTETYKVLEVARSSRAPFASRFSKRGFRSVWYKLTAAESGHVPRRAVHAEWRRFAEV